MKLVIVITGAPSGRLCNATAFPPAPSVRQPSERLGAPVSKSRISRRMSGHSTPNVLHPKRSRRAAAERARSDPAAAQRR